MKPQAVYLNSKDTECFKEYMEHKDLFDTLMDNGVTEMTNGSIILHYDATGKLKAIKVEKWLLKN